MKNKVVVLTADELKEYKDSSVCFGTHYDESVADCTTCSDRHKCQLLSGGAVAQTEEEATVEEAYDNEPSGAPYDKESFMSFNREFVEEYGLRVDKTKTAVQIWFPTANDFIHIFSVTSKGISIISDAISEDFIHKYGFVSEDGKGYPFISFEMDDALNIREFIENVYAVLKNSNLDDCDLREIIEEMITQRFNELEGAVLEVLSKFEKLIIADVINEIKGDNK